MKGYSIRHQMILAILLLGALLWTGTGSLAQGAASTPSPTSEATAQPVVVVTVTPIPITVTPTPSAPEAILPISIVTPTLAITLTGLVTPTLAATPEPIVGDVAIAGLPMATELTIYNQNVGLVRQTVPITLVAGLNRTRLSGVPSAILPTSVRVTTPTSPTAVTVVEQGYLYDLASSQAMLERYLGQIVSLRVVSGEVYSGTLLSAQDHVVLSDGLGVRLVRTDQVVEYSLPVSPDLLVTQPTLEWLLRAAEEGAWEAQISYLTSGINWTADYAAFMSDEGSLDLDGWITIDNQSGSSFVDARLKLVAGDIHRISDQGLRLAKSAEASPEVDQRALMDYQILDIKRPITLRDNQSKQLAFVAAPHVRTEKVLILDAAPDVYVGASDAILDSAYGAYARRAAQVWIEFLNDADSGLGLPLPSGTVRVYRADADGTMQFVGEDWIGHTPVGESLGLLIGEANNVVGERIQTRFRQLDEREIDESYQITLRNRGSEGVTVRVIERLFRAQDARIVESNEDFEQPDARTIRYAVTVQPDAPTVITYTVAYRW